MDLDVKISLSRKRFDKAKKHVTPIYIISNIIVM